MRISDWSSDVCSSDLAVARLHGQGLQPRSLARALAAWRGFFQWWAPQAGMESNPVAGVRAPKTPRSLPKALSVEQTQVLPDRPHLIGKEAVREREWQFV